jgi:hypothetical protein
MTISFAGALLLLPMLAIAPLLHPSPAISAGYALGIAGIILMEHIRRSKLLSLGRGLTITWILYGFLVLTATIIGLPSL